MHFPETKNNGTLMDCTVFFHLPNNLAKPINVFLIITPVLQVDTSVRLFSQFCNKHFTAYLLCRQSNWSWQYKSAG
jgi:hypothetical protein